MRKLLTVVFLFAFAVVAYAGSGLPPVIGNKLVPMTVPKVSKSDCKNLAAGKTGTATFTVSGTSMVNIDTLTSATNGTAVTLRRMWNSNTVGMPVRGAQYNLPVEAGATSLVFGKYSAADNSVTPRVCVEMN